MNLNHLSIKLPMKKSWLLPLISLGGGAVGLALRSWLFSAKDTGDLIRRGHPASWLLVLLCLGVCAALFLLTRNESGSKKYYDCFPASYVGGVGAFAAAVLLFFSVLSSFIDRPDPLTGISNVLGLLAVFSLAFTGYCRICRRRPNFLFHTIVCVYLAIFQLSRYRSWTANPEMQEYAYELLATVCLMLAAYHRAAFDLNMGRAGSQYFWGLSAVFFSMICLAGTGPKLLYVALCLWILTNLCRLPAQSRNEAVQSEVPLPQEDASPAEPENP